MSNPNPTNPPSPAPPLGPPPPGFPLPSEPPGTRDPSPGAAVLRDMATSGGAPRDFTNPQVAQVREFLDKSLFAFAVMVCGFHDLTPSYHGPICTFLERWGRTDIPGGSANYGWKRLMLAISRDTFKTSLGTISNALRVAIQSPGGMATIGIFNAKESRTFAWVRTIREIVESSHLLQIAYRERIPPGIGFWDREAGRTLPQRWRWSDHALDLVRDRALPEATISGHGATGSAAGWHFTHVIKDDIVELKHALSEVEMQRAWEWCETARYLENPAENGNELWNYTRWHVNDVYARARKTWANDYVLYQRPALEVDPATGEERSSFPERIPTPQLQREREERPYYFHSQRQLTPRAGRDVAFTPDWLRYGRVYNDQGTPTFLIDAADYDPSRSVVLDEEAPQAVPLHWCAKALLWDPAPSEESDKNRNRNARNGLVLAMLDPWGRWFLLQTSATREDPVPTLGLAFKMNARWGSTRTAVEEVNFSKVYKHFARRLIQVDPAFQHFSDQIFLPQKAERRNKDARIDALKPDFASGMVYLNRVECQPFVREYLDYPYGETRDLLDAFAMRQRDDNSFVVARPETPDEHMESVDFQIVREAMGGADAVTGYLFPLFIVGSWLWPLLGGG